MSVQPSLSKKSQSCPHLNITTKFDYYVHLKQTFKIGQKSDLIENESGKDSYWYFEEQKASKLIYNWDLSNHRIFFTYFLRSFSSISSNSWGGGGSNPA